MIIYLVVLAFLPLNNGGCQDILQKKNYEYWEGTIRINNDIPTNVRLLYWPPGWTYYDFGEGLFVATIVCIFGWVS